MLGAVRAETRQTALGTTDPPPFALFDTSSQLDAAAALEGTVTIAVTPGWAVEVRGSAAQPDPHHDDHRRRRGQRHLHRRTRTSRSTSSTPRCSTTRAGAPLGSRTRLYLLAGGGYLRQLHEDNVLVETGATGHAGGGARVWLAGGHGSGIEAGLTGDVRWTFRSDGIAFEDGVRSLPAVSLRAFVGF